MNLPEKTIKCLITVLCQTSNYLITFQNQDRPTLLKIRVLGRTKKFGFCNDATEEPFSILQRTFSKLFLKESLIFLVP